MSETGRSRIPTRQIDGDVSVGRHVRAGGDAKVSGNVQIMHDLKVGGWLEARNLKTVNKGLYGSEEELREAYPRPREGWFAGVKAASEGENEGERHYEIYVTEGGEWRSSGAVYTITVDSEETRELREAVTELSSGQDRLLTEIDTIGATMAALQEEHSQEREACQRALSGKLDKSAIEVLSEDEYENLGEKDPDKYYFIYE